MAYVVVKLLDISPRSFLILRILPHQDLYLSFLERLLNFFFCRKTAFVLRNFFAGWLRYITDVCPSLAALKGIADLSIYNIAYAG